MSALPSPAIQKLPDDLVDQIAAGEVVERPASVVKELLENCVDAGARAITVEIEDAGLASIRISDDGRGMSAQDARLAAARHTTSKLRAFDDFATLRTLGFRGEALASIASVSRFELLTRTRQDEVGARVRIEGGAGLRIDVSPCAPGTTVWVRDLFYNVPARRKFLRAKSTEVAHIHETCLRVALSDPALHLAVLKDGKRSREFLRTSGRLERAKMLLPSTPLTKIEGERDGVALFAMLSGPEHAQNSMAQLHVLINGRPVRDRAIARALAFGFGSTLSGGRIPSGVAWITVDPARVDVNVHPQKLEVRFDASRSVLDSVTRIVSEALGARAFSGPAGRGQGFWEERLAGPTRQPPNTATHFEPTSVSPASPDPWGLAGGTPSNAASGAPVPYEQRLGAVSAERPSGGIADAPLRAHALGPLRFVAQLRAMFLLCESPTGIVVLDQHAADERVRYNRLIEAHREKRLESQRLLLPERVELAESDVALLEERQAEVAALGLDIACLGPTTVAVRAVPKLAASASPSRLVLDLATELREGGSRPLSDRLERALATIACHASVRAGDSLSKEECEALVRSTLEVRELPTHCPHGRPILFEIGFDELGRKVGR